jgi:hypothetical protein
MVAVSGSWFTASLSGAVVVFSGSGKLANSSVSPRGELAPVTSESVHCSVNHTLT